MCLNKCPSNNILLQSVIPSCSIVRFPGLNIVPALRDSFGVKINKKMQHINMMVAVYERWLFTFDGALLAVPLLLVSVLI